MPNKYLLTLADGSTLQLELDEALDWTVASNLNDVDDSVSVLTTSRELVPFAVLRDYIVTQVTELGAQISEQITLPDVIAPTPVGTHAAGTYYEAGDIVEFTLADGRTGSFMCKVPGTAETPFGSEDWQIISLPAPSGQNNTGYTSLSLASETTGTAKVNLSLERRFLVTKNASKTFGFDGIASLGNAVVAFKNPLTGTPGTITWPSYVWWTETGVGTAPTLTTTPGRGDVILFRSWDGINVLAKLVEKNVPFETSPTFTPASLPDQKILYLFKNNSTLLQNTLKPGTDDLSGNTGTPRNPYGIDFIVGQDTYNSGALSLVSFAADKPWTLGFVFQGLLDQINKSGSTTLSFFGLASLTNAGKYIRPEFFKNAAGALVMKLIVRDNVTDIVGGDNAALRLSQGVASYDANTLTMVSIEYDGAGQFQARHINTDERLYDLVTGAAPTNTYPSKDSARILNYSEGLSMSIATTKRVGGKFFSTNAKVRYSFALQKVLTQAERKTVWANAKAYIANIDPTGPQLPALGY